MFTTTKELLVRTADTLATKWSWNWLLAAVPILYSLWNWLGPNGLRQVPTAGPSLPFLAYLNGLRYMKNAREILLTGYAKYAYTAGIFKVALADQWLVIVAGPKQIEDLKRFRDDEVSLYGGLDKLLSATHIIGPEVVANPYYLPLIHAKLNKNLSDFYAIMKEEMWLAFDDYIGSPTEWKSMLGLQTSLKLVSRTANRVIIGLPFCRDPAFMVVAEDFTMGFSRTRLILNMFPPFLKPFIAKLINQVPAKAQVAYKLIGPTVENRRKRMEDSIAQGVSWDEKPNDLLTWLLEEAINKGYSNMNVVFMILMVEFTALHTTAMSFAHALFYLAADPSLAIPLREEVERILQEEDGDLGSRTAVGKLKKIDSFLREAQRLNGPNSTSMWRKTLKPVTFSSGITIPAGVFLAATATATQLDPANHENPEIFDPWRFVDDSEPSFASTTLDYITFGHGKHACPGRHFAAYEMKLMMAYIVLNYDVKLAHGREGVRPPNKWIGNTILPDPTAEVLFRKRAKISHFG